MTTFEDNWKVDTFNERLKILGRLKGDDFEEAFTSFVLDEENSDDEMARNQATFHYFVTNSTLKNLLYVVKYLDLNYKGDFVLLVKEHIRRHGSYLRIAEVIIELNLKDYFTFEEVIIPLILCDASTELIARYVGDEKTVQRRIVSWLDDNDTDDFLKAAANYPHCQRIRSKNFKGLSKSKPNMIKKLVEEFDLDIEEVAPKLCFSIKSKDLKYWIKNLNGDNILLENWRDLILNKVINSASLQSLLITELARSKVEGSIEEANFFMSALNLDVDDFEMSIVRAVKNVPITSTNISKFIETETYFKLDPDFHYTMIDNCDNFKSMCDSLKAEYLWGIDCEFNSDVIGTKVPMMQLANKSQGFLVDLKLLAGNLEESLWEDFVSVLSGRSSVNQFLAFDPREDFKNLARTLTVFENVKDVTKLGNILDIKALVESAEQAEIIEDCKASSKHRGLSRVSELFLGQPLDKRQQISDWSKRPLTLAQKEYAILDARVLIQIYEALYDKVGGDDKALTTLSHIESRLLKNGNKVICVVKDESKNRIKSAPVEDPFHVISPKKYPPCEPPNLRVCCDNMLEGLSKQLRKLGVDSISISAQDNWERCGEIANDENRICLTRKKRLKQLAKIVGVDRCFALKGDTSKDQVREVFDMFNVVNVEDFIFSRCMKCNSDKFSKVARDELISMQISKTVPEGVLEAHKEFYVCDKCGHVYWEGSHFARVRASLKQVS